MKQEMLFMRLVKLLQLIKVQLFKFGLKFIESLWPLHLDKNGNAGDVQPIPVPKLNEPTAAEKGIHFIKYCLCFNKENMQKTLKSLFYCCSYSFILLIFILLSNLMKCQSFNALLFSMIFVYLKIFKIPFHLIRLNYFHRKYLTMILKFGWLFIYSFLNINIL